MSVSGTMAEDSPRDTLGCAAVLWTGGKDSCLALFEARCQGFQVEHLVTFAPAEAHFHAHPLAFVQLQARALSLPHHVMEVGEPYETTYQDAISTLRQRWGIQTLVTGDMGEVNGHPHWIRQRCEGSQTTVLTPLWGHCGAELLKRFILDGFKAIFSCVRQPWLTPDWLGRELDGEAVAELSALAERRGFDVCGEQGEYHTLVLDGPLFAQRICVDSWQAKSDGDLSYIVFGELSLEDELGTPWN
jgi:diphthine-ammonia ligase